MRTCFLAARRRIVITLVLTGIASGAHAAGNPLDRMLTTSRNLATTIATVALSLYNNSVCMPGDSDCPCTPDACRTNLPNAACTSGFGDCLNCSNTGGEVSNGQRRLSMESVTVHSAESADSDAGQHDICWTPGLTATFEGKRQAFLDGNGDVGTGLKWMYFGTDAGIMTSYPASPVEHCNLYDPRTRPWYVAAISGPKDVVLALDNSRTMQGQHWRESVRAMKRAISALTMNDRVAVVLYSDRARQLCGDRENDIPCHQLSNADRITRLTLNRLLDQARPEHRDAEYQPAITKTFDLLRDSRFSTGCNAVVIFVSSSVDHGSSFTGTFDSELMQMDKPVSWSTIGLGAADEDGLRSMACSGNGVYQWSEDPGDLFDMLIYPFHVVDALQPATTEPPILTDPYDDAFGAGILVTAAQVVRDTVTGALIGVAAADYSVTDMQEEAGDDNFQQVLAGITRSSQGTCVPMRTNTPEGRCALDHARAVHGPGHISGSVCPDANASCSAPINRLVCSQNGQLAPAINRGRWCPASPNYNFLRESCGNCAKHECFSPEGESGTADQGPLESAALWGFVGTAIYLLATYGYVHFDLSELSCPEVSCPSCKRPNCTLGCAKAQDHEAGASSSVVEVQPAAGTDGRTSPADRAVPRRTSSWFRGPWFGNTPDPSAPPKYRRSWIRHGGSATPPPPFPEGDAGQGQISVPGSHKGVTAI